MLEWEKCAEKLRFGSPIWGGGCKSCRHQIIQIPNHTDTKSDLAIWGGGKSYRYQIIQIPNQTWRFGGGGEIVQTQVRFGICTIWCLYDIELRPLFKLPKVGNQVYQFRSKSIWIAEILWILEYFWTQLKRILNFIHDLNQIIDRSNNCTKCC